MNVEEQVWDRSMADAIIDTSQSKGFALLRAGLEARLRELQDVRKLPLMLQPGMSLEWAAGFAAGACTLMDEIIQTEATARRVLEEIQAHEDAQGGNDDA